MFPAQIFVKEADARSLGTKRYRLNGYERFPAIGFANGWDDQDFTITFVLDAREGSRFGTLSPRAFGLFEVAEGEDVEQSAVVTRTEYEAAVGQFLAFHLVTVATG